MADKKKGEKFLEFARKVGPAPTGLLAASPDYVVMSCARWARASIGVFSYLWTRDLADVFEAIGDGDLEATKRTLEAFCTRMMTERSTMRCACDHTVIVHDSRSLECQSVVDYDERGQAVFCPCKKFDPIGR